ncbi:methylated-DNA--[protein]-cysteine S-methyltransferase [Hyphomicrobium sp.]|uniref:methylated-DNA--[protein]-cysteine S-methyltransferase n=1 Tax=Hyphomicrobium sp. TaxID=82 RepID=UPI002E36EE45|nr:methylated-DNA--[protein]-cysteine S-methyltransferase [Hyphomicrobium sp.]HEX2843598.1 methylated-DNA--[protein]-cysteine S-methyltransferase [Hyphomicrobium sp.]
MNLMIKTDALRSPSRTMSTPTTAEVISYTVTDSEIGKVLVARSRKGVCSILLGDNAEQLAANLVERFPHAMLIEDQDAVKNGIADVLRYLKKPSKGLNLPLDMRGTSFQRRVWDKLREIAAGRTVSYKELAHRLKPSANPRAVAAACAANPIALAIPCHRVVRTDGDLAGYRWGIERKRALIQKEAMA